MKITAAKKYDTCPDCKASAMVMTMRTGSVQVHGCLKCRNAQGMHRTTREAKAAWKSYVDEAAAKVMSE